MTIGAAKLFSQEANYGSVEDGKKANLVLMNGDFAEEKSKVEQVWVLGKSVFASKGVSK
jgi:imidazolonepropionase-like amidohydrolase